MINSIINFAAPVLGYENIWLIGDAFVQNNKEAYFHNNGEETKVRNSFMKEKFNISIYASSKFTSGFTSIYGRLLNQVAKALKDNVKFPRLILVVLDHEILKETPLEDKEISSYVYGRMINWLMTNVHRYLETRREQLPTKALKKNYPKVLWVQLPTHKTFKNNEKRGKFNSALLAMAKLHSEMHTIRMLKIWDAEDPNLRVGRRYTAEGILKFWSSIDSAVEHWESINSGGINNFNKARKPFHGRGGKQHRPPFNQYKWQRNGPEDFNRFANNDKWKKLPTPPRKLNN